MEWGLAKGLAVSAKYDDRIADERYYQQQMDRAKAENQASLKAFEDDTDYMNASNSFDNGIIKQEADKTIREMGALIRNNPNWKTDPEIRRQLKEKKVFLKSNPNVIRGMSSDDNFKQFNAYLQEAVKNPQMHSMNEIAKLKQQQQNYLKYGHQEGEEGLARDGKPQSFVFQRPQNWVNLSEEGLKTGSMIKVRGHKEHANGGWEEIVDETSLNTNAMDYYSRHKGQILETYNPKSDLEGIERAKELIRPGIDLKREFGKPHYNDALELEKWKLAHGEAKANGKYQIDPYTYDIKLAKNNSINTELVQATLGTTPQARIYNKDGSFKQSTQGLKFIPSGAFQQADDVEKVPAYIGKDGKEHYYKKKKDSDKIGVYHGYVEMTESELDESGLLNDKSMDDKIIPFEGKDKKGNTVKMFKVEAQVHSSLNNEADRMRYNSAAKLTNQQMNALTPMSQMQKIVDATGWTSDPSTGEVFDAQGNKRGTVNNYK